MRALMLALAMAALASAATAADDLLAGQWIAISAEENGASAPALVGHRLTFADDGFRIVDTDGKLVYEGKATVDTTADPATLDLSNTGGTATGTDWAGIWKRDGTLLTIVDNAPDPARPRPAAFAAPVGSGYVMLVFTQWK